MKVLITGGRDFSNSTFLYNKLKEIHRDKGPITELVHGGAKGADSLAGSWARNFNITETVYYPDWNQDGKLAGFKRNERMIKETKPDLVVAFLGGKGTGDTIRLAEKENIETIITWI